MKRVLITGGSGYLGSVITEKLLKNNYEVTILDNLMYNQTSSIIFSHDKNFEFIYGDVRNKDLLEYLVLGFDIIIPLAAIVGFPACDRDKELATAIPVSLWACMPKFFPGIVLETSVIIFVTSWGKVPPLVSHKTIHRAPSSNATLRHDNA